MYMATSFVPSGTQVLTCGSDRKIAYWGGLGWLIGSPSPRIDNWHAERYKLSAMTDNIS